jgi:membrane-bound inhibitor of C-type lysozyme
MKKILLFLMVLIFAACDRPDTFKCGNFDVNITKNDDAITVIINGDTVDLNHVVAASGVKYDGILNEADVVMWNNGDDWTLFIDDASFECK